MAGLEAVVEGRNPAHCLPAEEDNFGGVVVDVLSLSPTDVPAFVDSLHLSLELWRSRKKKGVWLKLPTEYSLFVHPAIQEGFKYHHAESEYEMLIHWLSDEPCTLPGNASHHVGVGAFVLNDQQEILAVQEKYGPFHDKWTMPTGRIRQGEDIFAGVIRELREETGIDSEFVEVIGFRQSHTAPFGKSDVFFLCVLRPLSCTIKVQESELTDVKWLPLAEFQAQKYLSERKMLKRMLDVCIETTKSSKGFRMENVQSGTPRGPQYFYNNCGT